MTEHEADNLPVTRDVRSALRARVLHSALQGEFAETLNLVFCNEGEEQALACLVAPWLMPFVSWKELVERISSGACERPSFTSFRNAQILIRHLLKQDFDFLMEERESLWSSLAVSLVSLLAPHNAQALRNALTYPIVDGTLRIDLLLAIADLLSQKPVPTSDEESELIDVFQQVLIAPESSNFQKGAAADHLGLLMKNSRYVPPTIGRPMALSFMQTSLEYFDREIYPFDWAAVHMNIGNLLRGGVTGIPSVDIPNAIEEYSLAASIFREADHRDEYAKLSDNLAGALATNPVGDRATNLRAALESCTTALRLWRFSDAPEDRLKASMNFLIISLMLTETYQQSSELHAQRDQLASRLRDVVEPLDSYYDRALREFHFDFTPVHLHVAERAASLVPALNEQLNLGFLDSRLRWLRLAQGVDNKLQEEGMDLGMSSRLDREIAEEVKRSGKQK